MNSNRGNLHCFTPVWSIILRFCRLPDRVQCSKVSRHINSKYKSIIPNYEDLMAEIGFIFIPKSRSWWPPEKKEGPSYLDSAIHYMGYSIGFHDDSEMIVNGPSYDYSDEYEVRSDTSYPGYDPPRVFVPDSRDWKVIFIQPDRANLVYLLNLQERKVYACIDPYCYLCEMRTHNKLDNYEKQEYPVHDAEQGFKYVCSELSFLNNFPHLFAERSPKIIYSNKNTWQDIIKQQLEAENNLAISAADIFDGDDDPELTDDQLPE